MGSQWIKLAREFGHQSCTIEESNKNKYFQQNNKGHVGLGQQGGVGLGSSFKHTELSDTKLVIFAQHSTLPYLPNFWLYLLYSVGSVISNYAYK